MTPILAEDFSWPLWPDDAPSASDDPDLTFEDPTAPLHERVIADVLRPRCFAYLPKQPNGGGVLVLAGGGYTKLVVGKEGVEVAQWLCSLGYHAFVLAHRFPCARFASAARSGAQAPVDDAIEAMRQICSRAKELHLDSKRIGVLGLSSGGHLASCLAASYPAGWNAPVSPHLQREHRPDFLIIGYAPISTNARGRTLLPDKPALPPPEKQALYDALQPDAQLADSPPPAFIVYSANDAVVPVENAYRLHRALLAKGAAADLHVFADAPHGFALRERHLPVGTWPTLCAGWLARLRSS